MTLIFFSPTSVRTTVNSVCSSTGAAAAAAAAAAPARHGGGRGGNAEAVLERLDQVFEVENRHRLDLLHEIFSLKWPFFSNSGLRSC